MLGYAFAILDVQEIIGLGDVRTSSWKATWAQIGKIRSMLYIIALYTIFSPQKCMHELDNPTISLS
jgi:hypothetical protein